MGESSRQATSGARRNLILLLLPLLADSLQSRRKLSATIGRSAQHYPCPPSLNGFSMSKDEDHSCVDAPDSPPSPAPTSRVRGRVVQNIVRIAVHATTANVTINSGQQDCHPRSVPSTTRHACAAPLQGPSPVRCDVQVDDGAALPELPSTTLLPRTAHVPNKASHAEVPASHPRARPGPTSDGIAERNRLIREALERVWLGGHAQEPVGSPVAAQPRPTPLATSIPHSSISSTHPSVEAGDALLYTEIDSQSKSLMSRSSSGKFNRPYRGTYRPTGSPPPR